VCRFGALILTATANAAKQTSCKAAPAAYAYAEPIPFWYVNAEDVSKVDAHVHEETTEDAERNFPMDLPAVAKFSEVITSFLYFFKQKEAKIIEIQKKAENPTTIAYPSLGSKSLVAVCEDIIMMVYIYICLVFQSQIFSLTK